MRWIRTATSTGIDELARFARGLLDDLPPIKAGLTLVGMAQRRHRGQSHRLKLVKRQGYGRAGFALLWSRLLHAVWARRKAHRMRRRSRLIIGEG